MGEMRRSDRMAAGSRDVDSDGQSKDRIQPNMEKRRAEEKQTGDSEDADDPEQQAQRVRLPARAASYNRGRRN